MAWLEPHPTSGHFNICLRWQGKKLRRTLKTTQKKDAEAILHRFDENVVLLERGRLKLPEGGDLLTFLLSDGKLTGVPAPDPTPTPAAPTLREIVDRYLATLGNGTVEANSLATTRMHLNHFLRKLGDRFQLDLLKTTALQEYVNSRTRRKGKKKIPLSPTTLRKEVATLRACWNWAVRIHSNAIQHQTRRLRACSISRTAVRGALHWVAAHNPEQISRRFPRRLLPVIQRRRRSRTFSGNPLVCLPSVVGQLLVLN